MAFQHFQELDDHISYVATKVCHLGDQLEGVNTPRQRAVEAQRLMTYFNEFLDGDLRSDVFNNPEKVSTVSIYNVLSLRCSLPYEWMVSLRTVTFIIFELLKAQVFQLAQ